MSADSELLIKIKTILESQGVDAAKKALDDLTQKTNAQKQADAAGNQQRDQSTENMRKAEHAARSLHEALRSGVGPFRAVMYATEQLGGGLTNLVGRFSALGAAAAIGWEIGTKLREWVTGAKDVEKELKALQATSDELAERVKKLNDIRLNNLKNEAEEIAKGFSTAVDKAERLKRLSDLREDAQLASDLAGVNLQFQNGEINESERERLEGQYTAASEKRKNKTEEKRIESEDRISKEKRAQAIGKRDELIKKAESSQSEYGSNVDFLKKNKDVDPALQDPEALLSDPTDPDRKEYTAAVDRLRRLADYVRHDTAPVDSAAREMIQKKGEEIQKKQVMDQKKADISTKAFNMYRPEVQKKMVADYESSVDDYEISVKRYKKAVQRHEDAQQRFISDVKLAKDLYDALQDLPSLKTTRDFSQSTSDAFSGSGPNGLTRDGKVSEYQKAMESEDIKQQELATSKAVLTEKYRASSITKEAKEQGVTNKERAEQDKAFEEAKTPKAKAYDAGMTLVGDLTVERSHLTDNAGLQKSERAQSIDENARLDRAEAAAKRLTDAVYKGADMTAAWDQFMGILNGLHAHLENEAAERDKFFKAMKAANTLNAQKLKNVQSQTETSMGTD